MLDDVKAFFAWVGLVVTSIVGAFVVFMICKCCTSIFGEDSTSNCQRVESTTDLLDLHGLTVAEALPLLQPYLDSKKQAGKKSATVITGRGLHSPDHRPVLKPAVTDWLNSNRYSYEAHAGHFIVYL